MALAVMAISCSPEDGKDGINGIDGTNGSDGADGTDGPQGPAGEDGNANVTLYTFPGHTFDAVNPSVIRSIGGLTEQEMLESTWVVYLVRGLSGNVYHVPGYGLNGIALYRVFNAWDGQNVDVYINHVEGGFSSQDYESIYIFRIAANTVVNGKPVTTIPPDLDLDNFYEVANYYNVKL